MHVLLAEQTVCNCWRRTAPTEEDGGKAGRESSAIYDRGVRDQAPALADATQSSEHGAVQNSPCLASVAITDVGALGYSYFYIVSVDGRTSPLSSMPQLSGCCVQ
ncbi:hypothetical protein PsYK624_003410 [Phanerochaete sordida]|uniref:Uncharacterized protein n=1 Tax=Phanerochaete sordida TaxID=48140 RepID=A0A9P3L6V7_9APHY|nr:hypothetical protein PsYK624_003410 [Phanerochaete sordida]